MASRHVWVLVSVLFLFSTCLTLKSILLSSRTLYWNVAGLTIIQVHIHTRTQNACITNAHTKHMHNTGTSINPYRMLSASARAYDDQLLQRDRAEWNLYARARARASHVACVFVHILLQCLGEVLIIGDERIYSKQGGIEHRSLITSFHSNQHHETKAQTHARQTRARLRTQTEKKKEKKTHHKVDTHNTTI